MPSRRPLVPPSVEVAVATVITFVWGLSFVIAAIDHDYQPDPYVGGVMVLLAGALFGRGYVRWRNGRTDDGDRDEEARDG